MLGALCLWVASSATESGERWAGAILAHCSQERLSGPPTPEWDPQRALEHEN